MASNITETGNALFTEGEKIGEIYGNRLFDNDGNIIAEKYGNVITGEFASGGGGIINSFASTGKEDATFQPYNVLPLDFVEQSDLITLNDDNTAMVCNKDGVYNIIGISSPSGSGTTQTKIHIYLNDTEILVFTSSPYPTMSVHTFTLDLKEGDMFRVYNESSGWCTLTTILFFKG